MLAEKLPDKFYFSIKEASALCAEKPSVLRYWEKEFRQLRPQKKHQQRRYQKKDIELILNIKTLVRDKRMTIEGAKIVLKNGFDKKLLHENPSIKARQMKNGDDKSEVYQDKDSEHYKQNLLIVKNTLQNLLKLL